MLVRSLMLVIGATGVELSPDDKNDLMRALEMSINGALIAIPLLWSAYQKWRAHQLIQDAKSGLL